MRALTSFLAAVLLGAALSSAADSQATKALAIDLGSEWTKVVLVDSKALELSTLDMVIDIQSNRKTASMVGFGGDDDRLFGEAAQAQFYRTPQTVVPALKRVLGRSIGDAEIAAFKADYRDVKLSEDKARGGTARFAVKGHDLSAEELLVMELQAAKQMAEVHAQTVQGLATAPEITDVVLIIPEWFSTQQRDLYGQLAILAGYSVRGFVTDLEAVAVDFGARNQNALPTTTVFYNLGSRGASAAVVQLAKRSAENGGGFTVKKLSSATEEDVGGFVLDNRMRDLLVEEFNKQNAGLKGEPITSNKRAMAKLLREAQAVKETLSVSPTAQILLEDLYNGKDFKATVAREQLEELGKDVWAKLAAPIARAIEAAGLKEEDIGAIELFGGATRIPKVQSTLHEAFPKITVAKHVDGDESSVFGAAHYLAVTMGVKSVAAVELLPSEGPRIIIGRDQPVAAPPLTTAQADGIKAILKEWQAKEDARKQADQARNALETYIRDARELLNSDAYSAKENAEVKEQAEALLAAASEFLDSAGRDQTADDFSKKLTDTKSSVDELLSGASKKEEKKKAEAKPSKAQQDAQAKRKRERERDKAAAKKKFAKEQAAKEKAAKGGAASGKEAPAAGKDSAKAKPKPKPTAAPKKEEL